MRGTALALTIALLLGSAPVPAAEGATGSAVGRVTVLRKGSPATAEPSWRVRFTSEAGSMEPIEVPLREGVYETPELPVGAYQVQVVDTFGQPVGAPQPVVLAEGATRVDLRLELTKDSTAPQGGDDESNWKVWAIVGGAAAILALVAGGGGGSDSPASPTN